jgi:hypothetical protein
MKRIALLTALAFGCTPSQAPDEFSAHLFIGQGESSGTSSWFRDRPQAIGSDSDFWMVGGTLTWYLPQPEPIKEPTHGRHGHPIIRNK